MTEGIAIKSVLKMTKGKTPLRAEDNVAVEKRLRISVNGKEIIRIFCTPLMIRELVVGLVRTEGIIEGRWCAERMAVTEGEEVLVDIPFEGDVRAEGGTVTSGCAAGVSFRNGAIGKIQDGFSIGADALRELFVRFNRGSVLYEATGCVHSAALSDGENILYSAEDIGRHNAVDKVIGRCLMEGGVFSGRVLLASGRLSSEMALKCARWKIPVVATRTAPTSLAVELAESAGLTLVGFVRGSRLNVYSHPERML